MGSGLHKNCLSFVFMGQKHNSIFGYIALANGMPRNGRALKVSLTAASFLGGVAAVFFSLLLCWRGTWITVLLDELKQPRDWPARSGFNHGNLLLLPYFTYSASKVRGLLRAYLGRTGHVGGVMGTKVRTRNMVRYTHTVAMSTCQDN